MEIESTTLDLLLELQEDACQKGLEGAAGYPLDVATEIAEAEGFSGRKFSSLGCEAVADIVDLLNREYEAGCKARARAI